MYVSGSRPVPAVIVYLRVQIKPDGLPAHVKLGLSVVGPPAIPPNLLQTHAAHLKLTRTRGHSVLPGVLAGLVKARGWRPIRPRARRVGCRRRERASGCRCAPGRPVPLSGTLCLYPLTDQAPIQSHPQRLARFAYRVGRRRQWSSGSTHGQGAAACQAAARRPGSSTTCKVPEVVHLR